VTETHVIITDTPKAARVVVYEGQIDSLGSADLEQAIMAQLEDGHRRLIIDMSGVDLISSRGLRMLVAVWKRARDLRGDIVIVALRPHLNEVMQMIGFDLVFSIYDTVDEALNEMPA